MDVQDTPAPAGNGSDGAAALRETGIEPIGRAPWGTHFCQFYAGKDDLAEILVPYFKAGLEQGEFCMWITSPPLDVEEAWAALGRAVPDLDRFRAEQRIEILPYTRWYLVDGVFDQERVLRGWVEKLEAARARGCCGLRLSGNTFWLEKADWAGFAEYEAAVDRVLGGYRMLALCTYALDRCGASEVADVIRNHEFALIKRDGAWERFESFARRSLQEAHARALREKQHELEEAQRIARIGSWYWDPARDAGEVSPGFLAIFGRTDCPPFRDQRGTLFPAASWDRVEAAVRRTLETGEPYAMDVEALRGDGAPIWTTLRGEAVRDAAGRIVALRGTVQDVTERKRIERLYSVLSRVNEAIVRIREETALYREVCAIVTREGGFPLAWIGLLDGEEIVPAAAAGPDADYLAEIRVRRSGPLGAGPTGTAVREGRAAINEDFDVNPATAPWRGPASRRGFRASASFPLRRGDRTIGALTVYSARPAVFDPAQVALFESLCADLSYALDAMEHERLRDGAERALRDSERSLREVDRRKNDFLAVLSHELRNPLAPIRNSLYVLERVAPGGPQAEHAQQVIGRQVEQLSRLVDDLLDVTRIARDKIGLQRERVDLNRLAERAVEDHRSLFEQKGVSLELALAPEALHADADPARLSQVIGNLLQNAVKFTPRGGRVRTALCAGPDGQATIRVSDDGVGMAPATLARLFEPFVQADTTLDRSQGGLGLGLALVRGLVTLHGGAVTAHSEGLGRGSVFTVRLPLDRGTGVAAAPRARDGGRPRRVLVIEDNPDAADSLADALAFGGHEVAVAHDGPAGLARARAFRPEVVLCDIGLPGMDGYEVARAFGADPALAGAFLVALSGYAQPDDTTRAREAGFDWHLAKPASLEAIERLLATRGPAARDPD